MVAGKATSPSTVGAAEPPASSDPPTPSEQPAQGTPGGSQSIAAVERAIDVLLLFGSQNRTNLGVTEIAGELGLSKAAVHRILTSLRTRHLVELNPETRRYGLGSAALSLSRAYLAGIDVRSMATDELRALSKASGETATLSIRSGDVRMYVDQVVPDREVRMEIALGTPYPLHAGASSKTFLAFLSPEEIDSYISRNGLGPLTDATITDPAALRSELDEIRARGYAVSFGERQVGAASAAAPVLDHEGHPAAVISVAGPAERFRANLDHAVELLQGTVGRLSERMGYQGR